MHKARVAMLVVAAAALYSLVTGKRGPLFYAGASRPVSPTVIRILAAFLFLLFVASAIAL